MDAQNLDKLQNLFRRVFDADDLMLSPTMTAFDVEGWDSLAHVELIMSIEKAFAIRLETQEIVSFKNVGELIDLVDLKRRSV